jgi:hypothetical protein
MVEADSVELSAQLPICSHRTDHIVNSANVRRFLAPNMGIDQQDAGETAPDLTSSSEIL